MSSLNKVSLIGNVGKAPEIRYSNSGVKIANFSLATSESWTKDGVKQERTEWHRIVCFNDKLSEVIQKYVRKGSKLYIEGQLQTRKWAKDGIDRYSTEITLQGFNSKLVMLGGNQDDGRKEKSDPCNGPGDGQEPGFVADDIPF